MIGPSPQLRNLSQYENPVNGALRWAVWRRMDKSLFALLGMWIPKPTRCPPAHNYRRQGRLAKDLRVSKALGITREIIVELGTW